MSILPIRAGGCTRPISATRTRTIAWRSSNTGLGSDFRSSRFHYRLIGTRIIEAGRGTASATFGSPGSMRKLTTEAGHRKGGRPKPHRLPIEAIEADNQKEKGRPRDAVRAGLIVTSNNSNRNAH